MFELSSMATWAQPNHSRQWPVELLGEIKVLHLHGPGRRSRRASNLNSPHKVYPTYIHLRFGLRRKKVVHFYLSFYWMFLIFCFYLLTENGKETSWDDICAALEAKKAQLAKEDNWTKTASTSGNSWSYRALRSSALGPTMAILRAQNELWAELGNPSLLLV